MCLYNLESNNTQIQFGICWLQPRVASYSGGTVPCKLWRRVFVWRQSVLLKGKRQTKQKCKLGVKLSSFVFGGQMWVRVTAQTGPLLCGSITSGGMVNSLNVSTASEPSRQEGWERHLVLCKELSRRQSASPRRYKNNPGITALAISR